MMSNLLRTQAYISEWFTLIKKLSNAQFHKFKKVVSYLLFSLCLCKHQHGTTATLSMVPLLHSAFLYLYSDSQPSQGGSDQ